MTKTSAFFLKSGQKISRVRSCVKTEARSILQEMDAIAGKGIMASAVKEVREKGINIYAQLRSISFIINSLYDL